jgi:membrane protein
MDLLGPARAFDRYQQRHRWLAIPVAVVRKFSRDRAGSLAAVVAYYGFFSLFPLLLVMTTVLGFVLRSHPSAQLAVEHSVLGQFPIIGKALAVHALTGSAASLAIGLVTAVWAGLGVTQAIERAFDTIWEIRNKDLPGFLAARLRGLGLLGMIGLLFVASTVASGLVSGGFGGAGAKLAGYLVSLLLNLGLFGSSFRLLTVPEIPMRQLRVGIALAAVAWTILGAIGGYYIGHVYRRESDVGAQFGLVIALLVWIHLGAQVTLYAAEVNVVLARKLWPRSLFGKRGRSPQRERSEERVG